MHNILDLIFKMYYYWVSIFLMLVFNDYDRVGRKLIIFSYEENRTFLLVQNIFKNYLKSFSFDFLHLI